MEEFTTTIAEYISNVNVTIPTTTITKESNTMEEYMYQVMLRNNHSYEATSTDGLVFMVKLDSGVRAYTADELKDAWKIQDVEEEEQVVVNQATNNKEDNMELGIYHFLRQMQKGDQVEVGRVITTNPTTAEVEAWQKSFISNMPVEIGNTGLLLLAMKTGTWEFSTLKHRLADKGINFRVMVLDHTTLGRLGVAAEYLERSTFAWANASCAFFLKVEGATKWGLDMLGLTAYNTKKISKRNQEIARITNHSFYDESGTALVLREFVSTKDVEFYDGMNIISRSLANKMGFDKKVTRINFRLMTEMGVIKGDAIIVPTKWIDADVVYHGANLKGDLVTNGWMLATGFEHHPSHMTVWDDQSLINNRMILGQKHQERDIKLLTSNLKDSLANGELPSWFMLGEKYHDEYGMPDMEKLSDRLNQNYVRWQAAALDINAAQNLVFMAINGVGTRMRASMGRDKMWLPMSNAFAGTVVTWEALEEMGNIRLPEDKKGLVFFDERFGLVIPGERFFDTYKLHGGWDQDDTTKAVLIKLWSSDAEITETHKAGFTVPADMDVPDNAEDAVVCAAFIRSPNGPGEFSIEMIDLESMVDTFHNLDMDNITVVNLAHPWQSLPQSTLLEGVDVKDLPFSVNYDPTAEFSMANAGSMIRAQAKNPGIGPMANMMMLWANTFGPSFPSEMAGLFETMVDATQQEADEVKFEAIVAERDNIFSQFLAKLAETPGAKLDRYVVKYRVKSPKMFSKLPQSKMANGRLTGIYKDYIAEMEIIETEIRNQSLQRRQDSDFVAQVKQIMVGADVREWAVKFFDKYTHQLKMAGKAYENSPEYKAMRGNNDDDGRQQARVFANLMMQEAKGADTARIVSEMVSDIQAKGDDMDRFVIGLYKYIVTDVRPGQPWGRHDRVIFQPGARGNLNVMDLFIQALKNNGF